MKKLVYLIILFCFTGCAGLSQGNVKNLTRIKYIAPGMTRDDVKSVMGSEVVIGYEITDVKAGTTKPITLQNPYRVETLNDGDKSFQAEFYFTHIRQADGIISDDELTPLIFEGDRLIAKGWDAVNKIRTRNR